MSKAMKSSAGSSSSPKHANAWPAASSSSMSSPSHSGSEPGSSTEKEVTRSSWKRAVHSSSNWASISSAQKVSSEPRVSRKMLEGSAGSNGASSWTWPLASPVRGMSTAVESPASKMSEYPTQRGGAVEEPVLEGADAVEARAVSRRVGGRRARLVAQRQEAGDGEVEVLDGDDEVVALAVVDVGGERSGEAVGLLLAGDGGQVGVQRAAGLHGVAVLVGHDDGEGERPEPLEEVVGEVVGVPGDEVVDGAVEGVLGDLVVGQVLAAGREHAVGPVGEEPAAHGLEGAAHRGGELLGPEVLDVGDGGLDDDVVLVLERHLVEVEALGLVLGRGGVVLVLPLEGGAAPFEGHLGLGVVAARGEPGRGDRGDQAGGDEPRRA